MPTGVTSGSRNLSTYRENFPDFPGLVLEWERSDTGLVTAVTVPTATGLLVAAGHPNEAFYARSVANLLGRPS